MFFGESRFLWFLVLVISLWILLFPDITTTSDCT